MSERARAALVVADEDALAKGLYEQAEWGGCDGAAWARTGSGIRMHWTQVAARLIAAGVVQTRAQVVASLAEDEEAAAFVEWVASNAAYNGAGLRDDGSDDKGQEFYDRGLNPWLYEQHHRWRAALAAPADSGGTG